MKITVEQKGGFAGIPMRRHVDTEGLSEADAAEVSALVAQADVFTLAEPPRQPGFDMQTYRVTVEDGERKRTLNLHDGSMPAAVKPLMAYMQKLRPSAD